MTGAWYRNVQRAPLYRRDLDVVAISPNGDIASFATCYFDDVSRTGVFVLDGTASQHRRIGLGKAVMVEALRRLQWLGATAAYVSWYDAPAGALYESVGFLDQRRGRVWVKRS
jgi:GNAT superfamily N-acetyltransferase